MFELKPVRSGFSVVALAVIVLLGVALSLSACTTEAPEDGVAASAGDITVLEPWLRAGIAGRPTAGYMVIHNEGDTPDRLVSAFTEVSEETQIHESRMGDDGEMMMVHMEDGLDVPAMGDLVLKPESYHVMLLGLTRDLVEGETVPIVLTFDNAGSVTVDAEVKPMAEMGGMDQD